MVVTRHASWDDMVTLPLIQLSLLAQQEKIRMKKHQTIGRIHYRTVMESAIETQTYKITTLVEPHLTSLTFSKSPPRRLVSYSYKINHQSTTPLSTCKIVCFRWYIENQKFAINTTACCYSLESKTRDLTTTNFLG